MSFKFLKRAIFLLLAIYFLVGVFSTNDTFNTYREPYPFFSWSLFSKTPNEKTIYTIKVYTFGEKPLEEPVLFRYAGSMFSKIDQSPSGYNQMIQRMGMAFESGDKERLRTERQALEQSFMQHPVSYELVKQVFDPIEYFLDNKIKSEESMVFFEAI